MKKVLIVEDESSIAKIIQDFLEKAGIKSVILEDGGGFSEEFIKIKPDLVILDLNLPGRDGIDICKEVKESSTVPVIMLTARVGEDDQVKGLEIGADDYITKPFSPKVLTVKVKKYLNVDEEINFEEIKINLSSRSVYANSNQIDLTPIEYEILIYLLSNPDKAISRDEFLSVIYKSDENLVYDRSIDVHIKNLRKKLGISSNYIKTVRGFGYKLEEIKN